MILNRTRTVGTKLRRAREWRGISLGKVADSTKLSVAVLKAMERDDISYLPGGVVGRGFVRSFAAAVKLDPEVMVAEFVAQFPRHAVSDGYPSATVFEEPVPPPTEVPIKIHRSKGSTLLRIAAVGLLPAGFAVYYALATRKPSSLWSAIQRLTVSAPATLGAYSLRAEGTNTSAQVQDSGAAGPSPARGAVAPDPSPANDASSAVAPKKEKPLKVTLSVTSPSWVIALVDGNKAVNRLMAVGEEESLEAKRELVLTAGNSGAVVMTLNGATAKSLGRAGQTVKVHVNHANFRNYLRRGKSR